MVLLSKQADGLRRAIEADGPLLENQMDGDGVWLHFYGQLKGK